jgi:hypothetical protein
MRKRFLFTLLTTALLTGALGAQNEFKSGPPVGQNLPGSFQAFNLSGERGKDSFHCLVCEYQLNPVVVTFIREGPESKDEEIANYLKKINDKIKDNVETHFLRGFVVFLAPDAASAATEPKIRNVGAIIKDTRQRDELADRLIAEATRRTKLLERLTKLAGGYDQLVVTFMAPDGPASGWTRRPGAAPAGYRLETRPGVTVVLYQKLKVEQVFAFPDGALNEEATQKVLKGIDVMLNKKAPKKKG